MSENRKKILQMLSEGKISVDEAQRLLSALGRDTDTRNDSNRMTSKSSPRYIYVLVEPKPGASSEHRHGRVNIRVPFGLIRAGVKLATLIPADATDKVNAAMREKGMSFDMRNFKTEDIEELVTALEDSEVNVDTDDATVKIYAE